MAGTKVIDADGHIIERTDELRKYLKSPFNKRGGPLTASEPWDRDLQQTLPPEPRHLSQGAHRAGLAATLGRSRHRAGIFVSDGARQCLAHP